ncbi:MULTISPECIES: hypothetical protein [unclassified Bradyrhizobium]|uniref:hypothetical protein n=1 Tax=unclassified Bradyrhizobium TaxID=2631580 RepID=UPI001FF746B1|nr:MULTISPECIES: hypothetical protein [unclassified Bradyrhizobium]
MRKPRGDARLVVVTHHAPAPAPEMPPEEQRSENDRAPDPAYRSNLRRVMVSAPDDGLGALRPAELWVYGHTHESFDAVIGETRVACLTPRLTARGHHGFGCFARACLCVARAAECPLRQITCRVVVIPARDRP